jgi:hypothetical protein
MYEAKATASYTIFKPEYSEWKCYLFGTKPGGGGVIYIPSKGYEPNWFARWMMKVCFDCTWVRENK